MTKIKVVLDTNIYLSGIIFGGNSRHILDLLIKKRIIAFISPSILLEISQKLKDKFHWSTEQIQVTVKTIAKTAIVVNPQEKLNVVKSDKDDNRILEAAIESEADYIITGDKHLLQIKNYQDIEIVSPVNFLTIYSKKVKGGE